MPWQHLKVAMFDIAVRTRNQLTCRQRTFCGHFGILDGPILKKVINSLGPNEQRISKHIATGAFWCEDQLLELQQSDGTCTHCGGSVSGSKHILWECPAINKLRMHGDLMKMDVSGLPLTADFDKPLWGDTTRAGLQLCSDPIVSAGVLERSSSMPVSTTEVGRPDEIEHKNRYLKVLCQGTGVDPCSSSARQAFCAVKGPWLDNHVAVLSMCPHSAPLEINVYAGGSSSQAIPWPTGSWRLVAWQIDQRCPHPARRGAPAVHGNWRLRRQFHSNRSRCWHH